MPSRGDTADLEDWNNAPRSELIEHIVNAYHRPLDEELPRLEVMARKVLRVHGDKMPEVLPGAVARTRRARVTMHQHIHLENNVLFPRIGIGYSKALST